MGGYGGGFDGMHMMGMGIGMEEPDFGVMATLSIQPGSNTFTLTGLGTFTDISQLAGRGAVVSTHFVPASNTYFVSSYSSDTFSSSCCSSSSNTICFHDAISFSSRAYHQNTTVTSTSKINKCILFFPLLLSS